MYLPHVGQIRFYNFHFPAFRTRRTEQLFFAVELRAEHGTAFVVNHTEQPEIFHVPSKSTEQEGLLQDMFQNGTLTPICI